MQRIKTTIHSNESIKLRVNKILRVIYAVIPITRNNAYCIILDPLSG